MTKRGGLGRGLAALIPTSAPAAEPAAPSGASEGDAATSPVAASAPAPSVPAVSLVPPPEEVAPAATPDTGEAVGVPGAQLREVAVDDVVPTPKQPRRVFADEGREGLD